MSEAIFQTHFTRWARYNLKRSTAWELKLCKGKALPFSALQEHQKNALLSASRACIHYKIPDVGMAPKPMDGFTLCNAEAYVVIQFDKYRNKEFFMIPIHRWILEEEASKRRSITEERAREIGTVCMLG